MAGGTADRFLALREAREYAPILTDFRLYWRAVGEALAGKDKLILEDEPGRRRQVVIPGIPWGPMLPAIRPISRTSEGTAPSSSIPGGGTRIDSLRKAEP